MLGFIFGQRGGNRSVARVSGAVGCQLDARVPRGCGYASGVLAVMAAAAAAAGIGALGCGSGKVQVMPADGGHDAPDARPVGFMCPAATAGAPRGLGGCCTTDLDCAGGVCWDGFCTKTCVAATDCGPVVAPSPLPAGTQMACALNQLGDPFSYCLPGSLAACGPGAPCPSGEACALGLSPTAVVPATASTGVYAGLCLTTLVADAYQPAGSTCEPEDGPYACENQGGYLGSGCVAHQCSRACASDADCPVAMFCGPAPFSQRYGGVAAFLQTSGTGVCLGHSCGQVHGQAGLATLQVTQQGADAVCPAGEICAPTVAVGATGDTAYLSCIPPRPGAQGYGQPCSLDPAAGLRCADDTLCVARGAGARFCSTLCRTDADCAAGSACMDDFATMPLPNGSAARLGMCAPRAMIAGTPCQAERDCAPTEACLPGGTRSALLLCQPAVGTKSVGQACGAATECRSGECVDRDLHSPTGLNRAVCGGYCGKNSDCGTGQICLAVVKNNNTTAQDPTDDLTLGYCTTLDAPALAGACKDDLDCAAQAGVDEAGGDTCDPVHLTCYKKTARVGDACVHRAECPLGAYCRSNDPRFKGGACLTLGCQPGVTVGPDACPSGSVCGQRGVDRPLYGCYEGCGAGMTCARQADQYYCDFSSATGLTTGVGICLWAGAT